MRRIVLTLLLATQLAGCGEGPEPGSPAWYAMELRNLEVRDLFVDFDANVVSAGQLTEEQLPRMEEFGFRNLVCLRPADAAGTGWEERIAENRKLGFTRIPIRGPADLTRDNAEALAAALDRPGMSLVYAKTHETVGALLALKARLVDGASLDEAMAFGDRHGLSELRDATLRAMQGSGR